MNIDIPRCATWPPKIWNTTKPEHRAEAEAWVRSLITEEESPWPPPKPDMTIAWGITEALIEENTR